VRTFTYGELDAEVCRCANALRGLGLGKGDAVGLYMPMIPELAIAFLAIVKIGGVILPLFSGYGPSAITARLTDADAKAVITADGVFRRGQPVPMKATLDAALAAAPTVEQVVVVRRIGAPDTPLAAGRDHWWHDLVPPQPTWPQPNRRAPKTC
jgi:acetyl-CoA synthetase